MNIKNLMFTLIIKLIDDSIWKVPLQVRSEYEAVEAVKQLLNQRTIAIGLHGINTRHVLSYKINVQEVICEE
jgi:hypothetical protein